MGNIRWGKTLVAAIAVEIALMIVAVCLFMGLGETRAMSLLDIVTPPAALILFVPAGMWAARGTTAPVLNGFVAGMWGVALYVVMTLVAQGAVADFDLASSARPAYLLAHGLKVVGGVIGGWLVARKAAPG